MSWMLGFSALVQAAPRAVVQHGSSSVEQYAGEELHRYLVALTGETLAIDDLSVKNWQPLKATPNYPEAVKEANEALGLQFDLTGLGNDEGSTLADYDAMPGFVLGTPEGLSEGWREAAQALIAQHGVDAESDGYVIAYDAEREKIMIVAARPRGVIYGAYAYLRERGGVGFFEDGERIPAQPLHAVLPPFAEDFETIVDIPKHDYRSQWIWTRYYGADRGHPINWGYEQWVSHLRWMAQRGFNSVLLYPVGYARIWGDVHRRAFPESVPFEQEVNEDAQPFWGAYWSIKAGWGRSPEETTRLMQSVLSFGREQLGLKFEYNFYLGNFEESLKLAYPEGIWIDWENTPHHAYFGAAGRSPNLTFTDPRAKELNQRFVKTFIETFGTDHKYWIAYREESAPNPYNPNDPDGGKSLADAVNTQREWIKELDPKAEFYHWDWHGWDLWLTYEYLHNLKEPFDPAKVSLETLTQYGEQYPKAIDASITFVNVIPPGAGRYLPPDFTNHFAPHPWVIGSLLGYAAQDLGVGGLYTEVDNFMDSWQRWVDEDPAEGGRLNGVLHWNEIIQVDPLLDHMVGEFAWTGATPGKFTEGKNPAPAFRDYYAQRYGTEDAAAMAEITAAFYTTFPKVCASMRLPQVYTAAITPAANPEGIKNLETLATMMLSVQATQVDNALYQSQLLDWSRAILHNTAKLHLEAAIDECRRAGDGASLATFDLHARKATKALQTLADVLATDQRHCLSDAIWRMTNEPGANRLMRKMMLEHASGRLFDNYALNDSAEFIGMVSVPLLESYLAALRKVIESPETQTLEDVNVNAELLALRNAFMEMPARPFADVADPRLPSQILSAWLDKQE